MIKTETIAATIISLIICLALPFASLAWLAIRRQRPLSPWLAGVLAFTVSQMLLRIPLIQLVLPRMDWYIRLSLNPVGHGLFLAVTAGLFEETARFLCFRHLLRRNRRWIDGISFGFGHGGIEAILITGLALVNMLVIFFAINGGTLDSLMAGADPGAIATIRQRALTATPFSMLLGGIERILAVALHIGMSMIVLLGIRIGRPWTHLAAAIGVHTLIDATVAILPRVMVIDARVLEPILAVYAALMIYYAFRVRRLFPEEPAAKGSRNGQVGPGPDGKHGPGTGGAAGPGTGGAAGPGTGGAAGPGTGGAAGPGTGGAAGPGGNGNSGPKTGGTPLRILLAVLVAAISLSLVSCGAPKLAEGFDEETVKQAARTVIQHMNAGEYEQISSGLVREDLRQALSPTVLANAASQILGGAGAFESFRNEVVAGGRSQTTQEDYAVAVMVAKYAAKSITYTITFDRSMKVIGFFLK